jgi:uncharacterized membrane protein YfcA
MSAGEIIAIAFAGMAAGTINTVVGSGTLITFPVLLAFGYAPVTANVSNTIGLVPGSVSGAIGYRRELAGQRGRALRFGTASLLGGVTGAVLLLVLPASTFKDIVPAFIVLALVLTLAQPTLNRRLAGHVASGARRVKLLLPVAIYATGVYGGYFGAGSGVMMMAVLGFGLDLDLRVVNALKTLAVMGANVVASVIFLFLADLDWVAIGLLAGGSVVGGYVGSHIGRHLPPTLLRVLIVIVGVTASILLLRSGS